MRLRCGTPSSTTMGRSPGFTLVELVVALSIVALALAVVPVSVVTLHEGMQYRAALRELLAGLKTARGEALEAGVPVAFTVDTGAHWFAVGAHAPTALPTNLQLGLVVAEQEVRDRRGAIRFYPDGGSTGGSIVVRRASGNGVRLRVDWLLGRVSQEPLD